ncbi:hypothetical protein ACLI4Q_12825 [Natrialbaceae archaeon A-CW1-1]
MAALTTERLERAAAEYAEREPLATVETERLETLPDAFADGSFLWKDAEWVVRWYARRPLRGDAHPAESAFRENDWDAIEAAIDDAVDAAEADDTRDALEVLTNLSGFDVPVASAYLAYIDPDRYLVVDDRLWETVAAHTDLDPPVPEPIGVDDYLAYLECCRDLARTHELELVAVYRALWRVG